MTAVTAATSAITLRDPRFRRIALAVATATFALTATGWLFLALSLGASVPPAWGFRGFPGIFAIAFGWIGLLVASRQPRNPRAQPREVGAPSAHSRSSASPPSACWSSRACQCRCGASADPRGKRVSS